MHIGVDHCQELVEGTGFASVDPPAITYQLRMPERLYAASGDSYPFVSKAQLEAIYYACQAFEKTFKNDEGDSVKYGFFLGMMHFSYTALSFI